MVVDGTLPRPHSFIVLYPENQPFKDEAQTASFKDPARTAL